MSDFKERYEDMITTLKQQRDELQVQMHLGKKEAQEEWDKLEARWEKFKTHSKPVLEAAEDSAEDVGSALALVGDELKKGYQRIRELLK